MSRRLDIELTSRREDGTWTWRAAGARRPKGEVPARLLPESAAVGTVLKAEADDGLDGLEIVAICAPRVRPTRDDRLELITAPQKATVTTKLVSKRERSQGDGERHDRGRSGSRDRRRADKRDGRRHSARRNRSEADVTDDEDISGDGDRRRPRRGRDGRRSGSSDSPDRAERGPRRGGRKGGDRRDRSPRSRPSDARRDDSSGQSRRDQETRQGRREGARAERSGGRDGRPRDSRPPKPRTRTPALKAKRIHRQAALEALPADQQPLAREVLRGGLPGLRKSIERMNAKAAAEKLPLIKSEPLIALAESLAPVLKAAEWHDRADAALAGIGKIDLRDIRSVIAAADRSARSDETRALAESLRAGLIQRLEIDHRKWLDELAGTIHEGRTVRALRLSSHPPKAGTPLPLDMAERLASMAAADLNPSTNQQRWVTVVDSVALSPVRTQVVPAGIPEKPTEELLDAIQRLADRVPQIAALFGVTSAPPRRGRRPPPPPSKPGTPDEAAAEQPPQPAATDPQATEQPPQPAATDPQATEQPTAPTDPQATEQPTAAADPQATEQPTAPTEAQATDDGGLSESGEQASPEETTS